MECNDDDDDRKTLNSQEREGGGEGDTDKRPEIDWLLRSNQFLHFFHWLVSPSFLLFRERDEGLEREWGPVLRLSISHSCNKSPLTRVPTCNFKSWSKQEAIQCNPRRCLLRVSLSLSTPLGVHEMEKEEEKMRVQTYKESRDGRREKKREDRQTGLWSGWRRKEGRKQQTLRRKRRTRLHQRETFFCLHLKKKKKEGRKRDFQWWMTQRIFLLSRSQMETKATGSEDDDEKVIATLDSWWGFCGPRKTKDNRWKSIDCWNGLPYTFFVPALLTLLTLLSLCCYCCLSSLFSVSASFVEPVILSYLPSRSHEEEILDKVTIATPSEEELSLCPDFDVWLGAGHKSMRMSRKNKSIRVSLFPSPFAK